MRISYQGHTKLPQWKRHCAITTGADVSRKHIHDITVLELLQFLLSSAPCLINQRKADVPAIIIYFHNVNKDFILDELISKDSWGCLDLVMFKSSAWLSSGQVRAHFSLIKQLSHTGFHLQFNEGTLENDRL